MAREPGKVAINLGGGKTAFVTVPQKIIDYFGLQAAVLAGTTVAITRERAAHERKYMPKDAIGAATKTVNVPVARFTDIGGRNRTKRGGGKLIKIPTEVPYDAANLSKGYRMVSLRVPGNATNYVIANWINTTFTTKKPAVFITPSGQSYPVAVPSVSDPNPGTA